MRMATWKVVMVVLLTLLAVAGTTQPAQSQCAIPGTILSTTSSSTFSTSSSSTVVNCTVPFGSTTVNIAGTYGNFMIIDCESTLTPPSPFPLGCSGPPQFSVVPGSGTNPVDLIVLTNMVILANASGGTLMLNFSGSFGGVPAPGPYARATSVDGTFVPGGAAAFGGMSYTAQAQVGSTSFDVINNAAPPAIDVGPSLQFAAADLVGSAFSGSVLEQQSCVGSEGTCSESLQGSVSITFNPNDFVFIPNSVRIAAARTGTADVSAALLGTQAQVQPPIASKGSMGVFNASRGSVPAKWMLMVNGVPTCQLPPATIAVFRTAGGAPASINQSDFILPSDTGSSYRIDTTSCQYVYNLDSRSFGPGTYLVTITVQGPTVGSVLTVAGAVFSLQ